MDARPRDGQKGIGMVCSVCGQRACYIFRGRDYCDEHLDKAIEDFRIEKEKKNG